MKTRNRGAFYLWMLLAILLIATGCAPTRIGVSWPVMDTVVLNDKTRILVAYNQVVTLIQPENGALTRLETPDGEVRFDEQGNPRTWTLDGHQYENAQFFARPLNLGEDKYLFPSFTNRLLTVDMILAKPDSTTGIALPAPVIAEVTATDDTLYVPLKFGNIVALDRETYEEKWTGLTRDGVWSSPVLVEKVVYVASVDHHLYAFDAETGEAVWSEPVDLEGLAGAAPLYYDGFLYVGSFSHKVYKISTDGKIVASFKAHNWIWSTPVVANETLYVTDLSGYVYAIDPVAMSAIWETKAASRGIRPAPLVADNYLVVASRDGKVYWLERSTGEVLFSREIEGRPEILSDLLLLQPGETLTLSEPLVLVSTTNLSHLVVALPLDYTSGYQGWVYAR